MTRDEYALEKCPKNPSKSSKFWIVLSQANHGRQQTMPESRQKFAVDHDACGVGFIARLGGPPSHELVERALTALCRLAHRGGVDADARSGDGAGLLLPIPETFMRRSARDAGIQLPEKFAVGMAFLPDGMEIPQAEIEAATAASRLDYLGCRSVPTDASVIGPRSLDSLPQIQQLFFASVDSSADFEACLFLLRKLLEQTAPSLYLCSLSSRTIIYKGLLTPEQLRIFYLDLTDPAFESSFAVFHQRYSTNTQPSWSLAQPFRCIAHNGEINTITANRRWVQARESELRSELNLPEGVRLLQPGMSDSASLDNAFEIRLRAGDPLPTAISRLVPPAWEYDYDLPTALRRFYESNAREQEPWDGPAALIFSDGETVGAKLDRNGLRPLRYTLTSDGLLIVASEAGVTDLHGSQVIERQRLGPGELLIADPANGVLWRPAESSRLVAKRQVTVTSSVVPAEYVFVPSEVNRNRVMAASGWTEEQFRLLFQPLVNGAQEPLWSMGDDTPPAFLSHLPRPLWDYCKQRFAQVTNPPIDPLRESQVMSLDVYLGSDTVIHSPLLDSGQLESLKARLASVSRIDFTFDVLKGREAATEALSVLRSEVAAAAARGETILLSDRSAGPTRAAFPALIALSAAWKTMANGGAWRVPLLIETSQVIDTHHLALLVAAGASAVHPWLALELAAIESGGPARYRSAIEKGIRKVLARMGIATIASYRNSQLFETIGLHPDVCAEFFEDAGNAVGGKTLDKILEDYLRFHEAGFQSPTADFRDPGYYRYRHNGEEHGYSPEFVRRMHRYLKSPTIENDASLRELGEERRDVAIRDLFEFRSATAIDIDKTETEASLLSRFGTQAMSLGAISPEAHRTLAIAMNRLGGRSNTGEGGEDPHIYSDKPEANNRVKQVASGRFGVTTEYLIHADEIEIKIAQGAKPGEGGQLPAMKVSSYIARLRHAVSGTSLISPPPHHDIYSIEDLAQLIYDLRAVNPRARIGVKLVSSSGVGIIAAGVAKAGADVITISGHDGGTGASPLSSIKNTGLPWELGLRDAHTSLVRAGLRARVRLRVDGGLKFARDIVKAAVLGAEEFGFATVSLLAIGCVMARQCHLNTCPVGIATQDQKLRTRFTGKPEMVETYFRNLAGEVRFVLANIGAHSIDEIVGDVARLRARDPEFAAAVKSLLQPVENVPAQYPCPHESTGEVHLQLNRIVEEFESLSTRNHRFLITGADRAVGAHFSGEALRRIGAAALEMNGVDCEFFGTAGQSFGAFLISGAMFRLKGEANDYVGKGLCGGTITVSAGAEASERSDVLVGNTVLYGATSGELYVAGQAGERFAVRNSGALAVVEGAGQHACEYMTAGVAIIVGPTGINLGAGMTGGLAYVLDCSGRDNRNHQSVRFASMQANDERWLRRVLRRHVQLTGSPRVARLLSAVALPFLRLEPVQPPCSVEETWAPILARLGERELQTFKPTAVSAEETLLM